LVSSLGSRRLRWLSGVSPEALVRLRLDNANVEFRTRLSSAVERLHASALEDLDRVAAEVCHEMDVMIGEHERNLQKLQERYNRVHGYTAVMTVLAGAALIPALGPVLGGAAPIVLAGKYIKDKIDERAERGTLTRSLVGVLAAARREENSGENL
jgi:hypothetical protein